jgi:crotonobetainyl-CoA:carnitine CoA-transferase CaiB-like acyl-CoA transferase
MRHTCQFKPVARLSKAAAFTFEGNYMSIFAGIKVLDVASFVAGPLSTTILADFGADVIKVEPPGTGDGNRLIPGMSNTPKCEHNYAWILGSRTKRGIALDLKTPSGQDVLRKLVESADVLVTNYPPKVRARLGLDYEPLKAINPRLVYAALTGYGEIGPDANRPGFDTSAYWARSGLADLVRADANAPPVAPALAMGDQPTAAMLYGAIVTALFHRERTGEGACVTTSLLASGVWANAPSIQATLCGGHVIARQPRDNPRNALTGFYRCRDGRWFSLTLLAEDQQFGSLTTVLASPDLLTDPRFLTTSLRRENAAGLVAALDPIFATRTSTDWQQRFESAGLTAGIVARTEDAADDEQMLLAGALVATNWVPGTGLIVDSPFRISGVAKVAPRPPPTLGQHTDEILHEHGFTAGQIVALRREGSVA